MKPRRKGEPEVRIVRCDRCDAMGLTADPARHVVRELPPNWRHAAPRRDGSPRIVCDACVGEMLSR